MTAPWKVDLSPEIKAQVRAAAERGLAAAAEHILDTSNRHVPVLTGGLKRSGRTKTTGLRAEIAYTDPISVIVHEDQRAQHDDGSAKFLENAMNSERREAGEIVAAEIRRELGT